MAEAERLDAPPPGHFALRRVADADGVVLILDGELDLATAPELEQELEEIAPSDSGRLLIDLSGLRFMDSTGLALMIKAQQSADTNGHKLSFRRGTSPVQRLFELSGVLHRFTFED